jgi:two-component system, OmpR family, sensor histidine kinase KdpD
VRFGRSSYALQYPNQSEHREGEPQDANCCVEICHEDSLLITVLTDSSNSLRDLNNLFILNRQTRFWRLYHTETVRKKLVGAFIGVASVFILGLAMLPLRSDVSVSTAALILVIPVVIGAAVGGFSAGTASVIAGFLVYDYAYIPPYRTLDVGTTQNWAALAVYVIVMLLVARVVGSLDSSRIEAQRGSQAAHHLSELSEHLVGDRPVDDLLETIVSAVHAVFDIPGVSLLVLEEGRLEVVASAGEALNDAELERLAPQSGQPISVGTAGTSNELRTIALSASGRAVGILALRGLPTSENDRAVLNTFANDAALAIERAQLREQALRSKLLEEVDRFRQSLMGAVSHDLRTPLATIKVASSTLSTRAEYLTKDQSAELYSLIEVESDRLTRLVSNLLDITRIEAGVFTVHRTPTRVAQLVSDAVSAMEPTLSGHRVDSTIPSSIPDVNIDPLLIGQVLINLLDNANRHSPEQGVITVEAALRDDLVFVSVADQGPGIAPGQRHAIFERFAQLDKGGRAGLGLTIAKTFVEAHGEEIWYEDAPQHGARFVFSLPLVEGPAAIR